MPGGLGPRFAIEAGFLIVLAVGAGLADLRPAIIVLVMGIAWVLVALIEWAAWREGPRPPRSAPQRPFFATMETAAPFTPDDNKPYPLEHAGEAEATWIVPVTEHEEHEPPEPGGDAEADLEPAPIGLGPAAARRELGPGAEAGQRAGQFGSDGDDAREAER